jgi:RNA polymerase sigma factor (sigma-70 family)
VHEAQQVSQVEADREEMQATAPSSRSLRLPSRLLRVAPDHRLVAALRRGDDQAFEAIYDRHHRPLLAFCRHMLGSHEEAEDALQRVFVSAHRHLSDGSADVNLKPWLYTIARNRCLSMLRARRETIALDDVGEPSSNGLALADEVELGEDLKEMLGDLARLPEDQRAALVLAELGDLSQREIAATLGVRTDKVKALIFQAREALAGWRQARAASCHEICEQLATLNGSALRRAPIRRHLEVCPTCAAFEGEVKRQRAALSLLLPVIPGAALKESVLTAALSASHGAAAAGAGAMAAGTAAGAGVSGLTAKTLVVAALATGAAGGGVVAVRELESPRPVTRPAVTTPVRSPAAAAPVVGPPAAARRIANPAASNRPTATSDPKGRKVHRRRARGRSNAIKAPGRERQPMAARTRPGSQRLAARRARPQAEKPPPVPKTLPTPAPATPRRPLTIKPAAGAPKVKLPPAARGRAPARP